MASLLQSAGDFLYDFVISGGYNKGGSWGGAECAKFVPKDVHMKETLVWVCLMIALYIALGFNEKLVQLKIKIEEELQSVIPKRNKALRYLDIFLGTLAVCNWCLVLMYKINIKSLINLLQPCHIVLMAQAYALLSNSSTGVIAGLLSLPMVTGSGSALLFPDTSGLDQYFEEPAFWLQHYFVQSIPLYLLLRYEFLATKVVDFKTLLLGNWILVFTHWILFEPIDYLFHVNVNFFLCPAAAMQGAFDAMVHPALMWPSYRSLLMWSFVAICIPVCYAYIYAAKVISILHSSFMNKPIAVGAIDIIQKLQNDSNIQSAADSRPSPASSGNGTKKHQKSSSKSDNHMSSTHKTTRSSGTKQAEHHKNQ